MEIEEKNKKSGGAEVRFLWKGFYKDGPWIAEYHHTPGGKMVDRKMEILGEAAQRSKAYKALTTVRCTKHCIKQ